MFGLIKKVGTAKRRFEAPDGREWEAEVCLHSGTDPQAPRLMVIFRDPARVRRDRYALMPPDAAKVPERALEETDDDGLRALLRRSTPM